jgi:acyl-CoA thioesterase-1
MHHLRLLCILAALSLLTAGCKSTPSQPAASIDAQPSPSVSAPTPDPAADTRPVIACFGDSLTAGFGADPGQSYPDFLQTALDSRGYSFRVVNEGISGNTTKDGVDRLNRVLRLKPVLVVVEFGGNDGLRGLPIEQSRANLDTILKTLTDSGTKVALAGITLPPNYGPDYIHQFNATYQMLAKKYHVPLLPFLLQGVFGTPGMMQADQTHATDAGNKIVADNVLHLITPLLPKP